MARTKDPGLVGNVHPLCGRPSGSRDKVRRLRALAGCREWGGRGASWGADNPNVTASNTGSTLLGPWMPVPDVHTARPLWPPAGSVWPVLPDTTASASMRKTTSAGCKAQGTGPRKAAYPQYGPVAFRWPPGRQGYRQSPPITSSAWPCGF
jgi:hypothetical protein